MNAQEHAVKVAFLVVWPLLPVPLPPETSHTSGSAKFHGNDNLSPSPDPCYFHLTEPRWHPGDLWQSFSLIDWQPILLALFQVGHLLRAGRTEGAMCASNLLWPLPAAPSCLWMDPFDKPSQKSPTVVHAWGCEGVSVSICIWRDWQNDSKIQFSCPVFFWSFFPHFNWVYAVFFSLGSLLLLCFGIIISAFHW